MVTAGAPRIYSSREANRNSLSRDEHLWENGVRGVGVMIIRKFSALVLAALCMLPLSGLRAGEQSYEQELAGVLVYACRHASPNYETAIARLNQSGWQEVTGASHPVLGALLKATENLARAPLPGWTLEYTAFAGEIAGSQHYLVITSGAKILACQVMNFEATKSANPDVIGQVLGLSSFQTSRDAWSETAIWPPEDNGGYEVALSFVDPNTPHPAFPAMRGLVLNMAAPPR